MMLPVLRLKIAGIATCVVMAGCGSSGSARPTNAQIRATVEAAQSQGQEQATLANAEQLLTQRCMQARGYRFYPYLTTAATYVTPLQGNVGVYNLGQREQSGYGIYAGFVNAAKAGATASSDPETSYEDSLSRAQNLAYSAALFGPQSARRNYAVVGQVWSYPTQGCFAQARRTLYGSVGNYVTVFNGIPAISNVIYHSMTASGGYTAALSRWSECMRSGGFSFASPSDAKNQITTDYTTHGESQEIRRLEVRVAVADMKCGERVGLPEAFTRALASAATSISGTLERDALLASQLEAQAVRRANAVSAS